MVAPDQHRPVHATMRDVAFTRWDSLRDLIALHDQLGHLVGSDAPGWTPPVDLYETSREFVLSAELPGLAREQIDILAEDNRITIRGARSSAGHTEIPCEQYHRVERGHGSFSRTFTLTDAIDVSAIRAELKDGILTVTIPKAADRAARRIDVS
jgi:HSP20 family protein